MSKIKILFFVKMYQFAPHYNNSFWSYEQQKYPQYYPQLYSYHSQPYNYSYPQQTYNRWITNLSPGQYQQYSETPKYSSEIASISPNDNLLEKSKQTKIINNKREKNQIKPKSESKTKKISTEPLKEPSFSKTELLNDKSTPELKNQFVPLSQKNPIFEISVKPSNLYFSFINKKEEEIAKSIVPSQVQKNEKQKDESEIESHKDDCDFEKQSSEPEQPLEKTVIKEVQNIELEPSINNSQISKI